MTLACLLLMQCCSMHMVPGGAGHVWFIGCVPTHRPRAFIPVICIPDWVKEFAVSPPHWLTAEVTDRPAGTGAFSADGRCGDLTQSEPWHTCLLNESTFRSFHTDVGCAQSYTSCRGMSAATSGDSLVLLCTTSVYMWIPCAIPGSNFSWFILFYVSRCLWFTTTGHYESEGYI